MLNNLEISSEAVSLISAKHAFERDILPIEVKDNVFHVGVPNKNDLKLLNDISFYTGYKIKAIEIPPDIILQKLKEIYKQSDTKKNGEEISTENVVNEYSNIEFVNQVITGAIKSFSSDIHFESFENSFRVRYRIDGHLREVLNLPKDRGLPVASRLKIMANLDISEKRRPQDGKIRFPFQNNIIDIRVSSLPTSFGEKIVLRILNKSQVQLDLSRLGLSEPQLKILKRNINLPYGMILVTGPTGSGKTTTLYAALQAIHSVEKNIITVEDPIEYNFEGINQSNVKPEIGYDFACALRSFLRQDPDVIMVGEIRDRETAEIAIRASLTGHLVFSTLHTNDSSSAVTRLIDMGIEPFLVASSLRLVIAQRLVRVLCSCKDKAEVTDLPAGITDIHAPKGCSNCSFTGYKGRLAIFELLEINEGLSELISAKRTAEEIRKKAKENGFLTLRESGIEKINLGITSYDEVLRETML
ncbi:MAG: GspE/PulE family protein [Ignavibacteriaceae bacterium]